MLGVRAAPAREGRQCITGRPRMSLMPWGVAVAICGGGGGVPREERHPEDEGEEEGCLRDTCDGDPSGGEGEEEDDEEADEEDEQCWLDRA